MGTFMDYYWRISMEMSGEKAKEKSSWCASRWEMQWAMGIGEAKLRSLLTLAQNWEQSPSKSSECRLLERCHHLIKLEAVYPSSQGGYAMRNIPHLWLPAMAKSPIVNHARKREEEVIPLLPYFLGWANIPIRSWQFALLLGNEVIIHYPLWVLLTSWSLPPLICTLKWNSWRAGGTYSVHEGSSSEGRKKSELFCFLNGFSAWTVKEEVLTMIDSQLANYLGSGCEAPLKRTPCSLIHSLQTISRISQQG